MAYKTKIKYRGNNTRSGGFSIGESARNALDSVVSLFKRDKSSAKGSAPKTSGNSWRDKFSRFRKDKFKTKRWKKTFYSFLTILGVVSLVGAMWFTFYLRALTEDLPDPTDPFGKEASVPTEIYDRNGRLLYKVFEKNKITGSVEIEKLPPLVKWAYLSAEDVDFYEHPGVDVKAILRCGLRYVIQRKASCGGSTITQQVIKQAALKSNERSFNRKIKEVVMSLQLERKVTKDEILEMYLTISPEGSNIYGVTSAASFYFGKDISQLNLAEIAILAAIPQNPSAMSPTKASDTTKSQQLVKQRQEYVLDQMEKNIDKINRYVKEQNNVDNALTKEMIQEARDYKLTYVPPKFEVKSGHFVFFAIDTLQARGYNNGVPFTLAELETGGYKIYTTLDLDFQAIAEEQTKKAVDNVSSNGGQNAALIAMNPKTGEILAMAGSKDYSAAKSLPEGCTNGVNCKFEPQVNVITSKQSPGSTIKPFVYYKAIMDGYITPGSILADVPIAIGSYKPRNYEGGFRGFMPARQALSDSRNIPAITLVDQVGVSKFVEMMRNDFRLTTLEDTGSFGPSIGVGGMDMKMVEFATAYGVLANEGKYTQYEPIMKIEDRSGKVVYQHAPVSEQVADPRGTYMVSHMLNGKNNGPGKSWDGRDIAGKTGTSEDFKEVLFATYTPEIVALGWAGNNDNSEMRKVSGFNHARPFVAEFVQRIGGSIPPTKFKKPDGVIERGVCEQPDGASACGAYKGDLAIAGIGVPSYVTIAKAKVCTDQADRLARAIDEQTGFAVETEFKTYKMHYDKYQKDLDEWLLSKPEYGRNGPPTEYCDINRNPGGTNLPWATIVKPSISSPLGNTMEVDVKGFSLNGEVTKMEFFLDGSKLGEASSATYTGTFNISPAPGSHSFEVKVTDAAGSVGTSKVTLQTLGVITLTAPDNVTVGSTVTVNYTYTGSALATVGLYQDGVEVGECSAGSCTWDVPSTSAEYNLKIIGSQLGQLIESNVEAVKAS